MYLSSFAMTEPEGRVYMYAPSWLNVWESHLYNRALKSTRSNGWGFKRFGTGSDIYASEMIRTPHYTDYIVAMEDVSEAALHNLSAKERMLLMKSRTAFIYADSWGESSSFENINSALHQATIDTLPKNLIKKFAVKDFSCKIRGEKQSLVQAMRLAQDYLDWDIFDFVVICAAYRAVPVLVFSDEDLAVNKKEIIQDQDIKINLSVERVGCFIFSQRESSLKINTGKYIPQNKEVASGDIFSGADDDIDLMCFSGLRRNSLWRETFSENKRDRQKVSLPERYGGSGCLTPALSWIYLQQHTVTGGKMRTIVPDNVGGYQYFDTWFQGN
ncbi:ATP-binding protein [Rahnella sikkimica]|uniref:ATP-binding protein n=1 Tax=Rahnella sikkimica TaxID=1805933 RepID=A0A2L1UY70_9GAMM|nr:ATP-binding protein [Rahnella sikkimica]AVF37788.1 ATP-binding protein [Rahnella sikkimica]